ncbi:hypothetical protein AGMMS50284_6720 [Clostridia bacterium]|nr:hypothetical protein AGMMS50284_6720 [Clostridia bacterium]
MLENDIELAQNSLPQLFNDENVVTRSKSAAHCIALNIYVDEAKKILKNITLDKENSIFASVAKLTLQALEKQGYLKVYKEQIPRYLKKISSAEKYEC